MKHLIALALFALPFTAAAADRPSVHGMLVFGGKSGKVYVSHLPMFHSPHDYQLIAELELPAAALATYKEQMTAHPEESVYTLVPETMVLPELVANPHAFQAELVRGHFERGGTTIASALTVKLGKILHFRKFIPGSARPANATYLYFGSGQESFLAHFISVKPDFDQIVAVAGAAIPQVPLVLVQSTNPDTKPLSVPSRFGFTVQGHDDQMIRLQLVKELYLEHGDLAH